MDEKKLVHIERIAIRWGDMDAMGHVNNTVYFRYMEQARIAIYRDLSTHVLLGLAARELAGKLNKIDHLNVTPDLLASIVGELGGTARPAAGKLGKE